jgi:hypothetical protein
VVALETINAKGNLLKKFVFCAFRPMVTLDCRICFLLYRFEEIIARTQAGATIHKLKT